MDSMPGRVGRSSLGPLPPKPASVKGGLVDPEMLESKLAFEVFSDPLILGWCGWKSVGKVV